MAISFTYVSILYTPQSTHLPLQLLDMIILMKAIVELLRGEIHFVHSQQQAHLGWLVLCLLFDLRVEGAFIGHWFCIGGTLLESEATDKVVIC